VLCVIRDLGGQLVTVDRGERNAHEVGDGRALELLRSGGWQPE
jgi:hypothetical protein